MAVDSATSPKGTKYWAIFWTILYIILFPFLFYTAMLTTMVFDNPSMTTAVGISIIIICFFVPLSIPISVFFIWSNYWRAQYKKTRFFCALPILIFGIVFLLNALLQTLFLD